MNVQFNHTMLRIKVWISNPQFDCSSLITALQDPKASLKFYQEILGMELLDQHSGGDFVSRHFSAVERRINTALSGRLCTSWLSLRRRKKVSQPSKRPRTDSTGKAFSS